MQSLEDTNKEDSLINIDKTITCISNAVLFKHRFGIKQMPQDLKKYKNLKILKNIFCMPVCIKRKKLIETIKEYTK